ncbi:hypothetical protein GUJ93_ZPchr0008g11606 [Zizania palustris]|uniref:DNA repair protein RAD51 homolog 3 n=1 Tax=Zizania palustris TaxID=103762 RepID=A0A8J5R3E3_ZIZPA|nr:hypothetical protein GUJ93_ZPchr0008g11606 [Zizania palustris]
MEIADLPICTSHRAKLLAAGYSSLAALSAADPPRLALDLNIEIPEAEDILKIAVCANKFKGADGPSSVIKGAQNAWDMLSDEQSRKHINTGSGDLNNILGGGIHCKEVTEIGGVPGIGKTQLGIQLAINVQIPVECGGLGGKSVYIDTEGSFMVERVYQIAEGCISDILEYFPHYQNKAPSGQEKLKPESFLADIYYFRICSYTEQIAVINYLEKFLGEHKDVRIVIIDSVTFHFRQDFDDMALRTRVLSGLSLKLMKLAKTYNLAVVLLNQVTTKFTEGSFQLTLALGDSWSHSCTNRLILYWDGNLRYAYLDKSPSLPAVSAPYAVTGKGVRDAVSSNRKRARVM